MANLLGRMLRYVADAAMYAMRPYTYDSRNPQLRRFLRNESFRPSPQGEDPDLEYYMRLAVNNPELFSAVSLIADNVGNQDAFMVQKRRNRRRRSDGGEGKDAERSGQSVPEWVDVPDHDFLTMLRRPNSMMPGGYMLRYTVWWLLLSGNAYWYLVTDEIGIGPIREIWPLPASRITPRTDLLRVSPITGRMTLDFEYNYGDLVTLPGENILHIRYPNLFDYFSGMGNLNAIQLTLDTHFDESSWISSYFGDGNAIPTAVISVPPDVGDEEFELIREDILRDFAGQRRTAIARAGEFEVETIQHSIEEMQVYSGLSFHDAHIRRTFRVPDGLSGASSGQARLAAETALYRDSIQPLLDYMAEYLSYFVIPFYEDDPDWEFRVIAEDVVPQDRALKLQEYQVYGQDQTLNERRKQQNLDPIRFEGPLAQLQPLVDDVPMSMLEMAAQLVLQGQGGAPGMPGGNQGEHPLLPYLTGEINRDFLLALMTGDREAAARILAGPQVNGANGANGGNFPGKPGAPAGPGGGIQEANYRDTNMPTQEQLIRQMLGQPSGRDELEAFAKSLINDIMRASVGNSKNSVGNGGNGENTIAGGRSIRSGPGSPGVVRPDRGPAPGPGPGPGPGPD